MVKIDERAYQRVMDEDTQAYRLAPGRYAVPSKSKPGEAYELVVRDDGAISCNCPAHAFRGTCKHEMAVWLEEA